MVYQSVSMDDVIGRIIRNTRVQDTSYIADMVEWIPEAMEMMQTRQETIGLYAPHVRIKFHKSRLPLGTLWVEIVEHCGLRLPQGNGSVRNIMHSHARTPNPTDMSVAWTSEVFKYPAPGDQASLYWSTFHKANNLPVHDKHYYEIEMGCILTDFSDGEVAIHARAIPTDDKGLPLVPDNSNYKEALYWYVRGKMIGAGFDDRIVKMDECDVKFEKFAGRAIAEIDYPSPNEMEHRINTFTRLVPIEGYFENFFKSDHREQVYDPMGPHHRGDII